VKNVLIVAPHFPPSGLPPSHRARQFATHLPRYGWRPTVLTVRPEFYQEVLEQDLVDLIPAHVEVVRTRAIPPKRPGGLGVGDLGIRVLFHQTRTIVRLCRERRIDLVYLPCPPNHQLLLGRWIHARLGVPYVFDYIDPWISDWLEANASPLTKLWVVHQLAKRLEPAAIARASGITAVSSGTIDGVLRRYAHLKAERAVNVPYGAEPELYDMVRQRRRPQAESHGTRRLLYLGAMWEAAYDTLRAFLAALRRLKECNVHLYRTCRVDFVGTSYAPDARNRYQVRPLAEEAGVADAVTETPSRLPFLDALSALAMADCLLMIGSSEAHYTPSRLLPYVFARRPILAIMNASSDATTLLRRHEGVRLISYSTADPPSDKVDDIYAALVNWLDQPPASDLRPLSTFWDGFTTRSLTGRVAALFDEAVGSATPALPVPIARAV